MTPKEKAHQIVQRHLLAQIGDNDKEIVLYIAKQCALVTVACILEARPGYPYPHELNIFVQGIYNIIRYPDKYWKEVMDEIGDYDGEGYLIERDPDRITCFECGKTSYNSNDAQYKYCASCDKFH